MTHAETPEGATSTRPVLFVADADGVARAATESALSRRFGADYRVLTADSTAAGVDILEQLSAPFQDSLSG